MLFLSALTFFNTKKASGATPENVSTNGGFVRHFPFLHILIITELFTFYLYHFVMAKFLKLYLK